MPEGLRGHVTRWLMEISPGYSWGRCPHGSVSACGISSPRT
nr:type I-E CRISPR-associated endoribonuclease Cas2 [Actinomyces sp. ICM39]